MANLDRRVFLAVGGAALVGAGAVSAQRGGQGRGKDQPTDPIIAEIQRQITVLAPQVEAGSAAAALQCSSALHTLAAWMEANDSDGKWRAALRRAGRQATVKEVGERWAQPHGPKWLPQAVPSPVDVEQALAVVDQRGPSAIIREAARNMERLAPKMPGVMRVQSGTNTDGSCNYETQVTMWVEFSALAWCAFALEFCILFGLVAATYHIVVYYTSGCS